MLTLIVSQNQARENFTLKDLMEFSKKTNVRVIIRNFAMFENGVVSYLS